MSVGEFVSLLFLLISRPTNHIFAEKILVIQLFFKDFVSTFSNFLGVPVYLGHSSEWLLPGCGKCTGQECCVKICVKEGNIFLFEFVC